MGRTKSILRSESVSNVVFAYKAREFPLVITETAKEFVGEEKFRSSDFQISPLVAEQAGIARLKREATNEKIEEQALLQLKSVQEKAYQEAYDLGLSEGRAQALEEHRSVLETKLKHLDELLMLFENYKSKLVADHETHIISLIFKLASRIAMREIKSDPAAVLPVVLQVVADAQSDEQLMIRVAPEDLDFLEQSREKTGKAADSLRRVRFQATEGIKPGGCLLESNYGSIDATIETRVNRAWEAIRECLPRNEQRTPSGEGGGESHES